MQNRKQDPGQTKNTGTTTVTRNRNDANPIMALLANTLTSWLNEHFDEKNAEHIYDEDMSLKNARNQQKR